MEPLHSGGVRALSEHQLQQYMIMDLSFPIKARVNIENGRRNTLPEM